MRKERFTLPDDNQKRLQEKLRRIIHDNRPLISGGSIPKGVSTGIESPLSARIKKIPTTKKKGAKT